MDGVTPDQSSQLSGLFPEALHIRPKLVVTPNPVQVQLLAPFTDNLRTTRVDNTACRASKQSNPRYQDSWDDSFVAGQI